MYRGSIVMVTSERGKISYIGVTTPDLENMLFKAKTLYYSCHSEETFEGCYFDHQINTDKGVTVGYETINLTEDLKKFLVKKERNGSIGNFSQI